MKLHHTHVFHLGLLAAALTAPSLHALEFEPSLAMARNSLIAQNLPAARDAFATALTTNPQSGKARVGLALCDLVLVFEDPAVKGFLDRWQFTTEGRNAYNWTSWTSYEGSGGDNPLPDNANLNEVAPLLESVVIPRIQETINHLEQIQSPGFELYLRPEYFGDDPLAYDVIIADYTDVQLLRSGLLLFSSLLRMSLLADNADLPATVLRELFRYQTTTLEEIFSGHPAFGTLQDGQQRTEAKAEFKEAIEIYTTNAAEFRLPERRDINVFFISTEWDLEKEGYLRGTLLDLYAALDGPALVSYSDGWESTSRTIDLRPVFSPTLSFRPFLPDFDGNLIKQDSMPDPSLQGMLPDFTQDDWSDIFASFGVLRINPVTLNPGWRILPGRPWTTSSYKPWTIASSFRAESGLIGDNCSTWIETMVHGPAVLTFDWGVSSEQDFDYLRLYVDGIPRSEISGEQVQMGFEQRIGPGPHPVRWEFSKDYCCEEGTDQAWLSNVELLPESLFISDLADSEAFEFELLCNSRDATILGGVVNSTYGNIPFLELGNGGHSYIPDFQSGQYGNEGAILNFLPNGNKAVGVQFFDPDHPSPILWEIDPYTDSPSILRLPTSSTHYNGVACALSAADGKSVAGFLSNPSDNRAAIWHEDVLNGEWMLDPQLLSNPYLPGLSNHESWLYDISADGQTAVGDAYDGPLPEGIPIFWTADQGLQPLPLPEGFTSGFAVLISADGGKAVGLISSGMSATVKTAVWTRISRDQWTVEGLPSPSDREEFYLIDISEDASILSAVWWDSAISASAFVWENGTGWISGEELIASEGLSLPGLKVASLSLPYDASTILGLLTDSQGGFHTMVHYRNQVWTQHALMGRAYRQNPEYLFSSGMGHAYLGMWPHIYIFENNIGWMRHVRSLSDQVHILYSTQWEWVLYDLRTPDKFRSSAQSWGWVDLR